MKVNISPGEGTWKNVSETGPCLGSSVLVVSTDSVSSAFSPPPQLLREKAVIADKNNSVDLFIF
jgi:hypothetical protein